MNINIMSKSNCTIIIHNSITLSVKTYEFIDDDNQIITMNLVIVLYMHNLQNLFYLHHWDVCLDDLEAFGCYHP